MKKPKKRSLNDIYDFSKYLVGFSRSLCQTRVGKQSKYVCAKCGSDLTHTYLENRIYLVVCENCEITSITEADSPMSALNKVGVINGEI